MADEPDKREKGDISIGMEAAMTDYEKTLAFWRQQEIRTDAELSAVLNAYCIAFAYHSGKIENDRITYHDTREIFEHDGVTSYTGDLRTLFEIRNAKDAYELFLTAFQVRRPIDEALVKDLQCSLTKNTYDARRWSLGERPGTYKQHDYVTGREEVGAPPEDVQEEVAELLEELQDVAPKNALVAAAYFHAKFENIHPFADGNGRVGRMLMNYFLILQDHPPLVIHEEDRRDYYEALEAWDRKQELKLLVFFLQEQTVKTWKRRTDRMK